MKAFHTALRRLAPGAVRTVPPLAKAVPPQARVSTN